MPAGPFEWSKGKLEFEINRWLEKLSCLKIKFSIQLMKPPVIIKCNSGKLLLPDIIYLINDDVLPLITYGVHKV